MIVLRRFLRDARRSLRGWAIGMLALVGFTVAFYPSVKGQEQFDEIMRDLPEAVRVLVGVQEGIPLTSPAGYLHARLFALMLPVLLLIYGVGLGTRAIAGSEADGTLELLLANPLSRRTVLRQRYLGVVALMTAVTGLAALALVILGPLAGLLDGIRLARLGSAAAAVLCLALLHATVAFAVGGITGRPGVATAAAASVAAAGYLFQGVAAASGGLPALETVSPWHWYLDRNVVAQGSPLSAFLGPVGLCLLLLVVAERIFLRRDLR